MCYTVDMGKTYPGERNPFWKGGRTIASNGYVLVKRVGHPMADTRGYVYEHRLVASEMIGRSLARGEIVHHKNGDKLDNRPENLEVLASASHHLRVHYGVPGNREPGEPNPTIECKCGCGAIFEKYDRWGRPRQYKPGHNIQ